VLSTTFKEVWYSILWHIIPFLGNIRETKKQRLLLENNQRAAVEILLEVVFFMWSVLRLYQLPTEFSLSHTCVEAGSSTSTVTLRVVGGDEKGSLKSERVKYGHEFQGTRARERMRWQGSAAYTKDRPVLSSEWVPHKNKTVTVKQLTDGARHQDLLTH
jgi:hypothetical protein